MKNYVIIFVLLVLNLYSQVFAKSPTMSPLRFRIDKQYILDHFLKSERKYLFGLRDIGIKIDQQNLQNIVFSIENKGFKETKPSIFDVSMTNNLITIESYGKLKLKGEITR